MKALKMCLICRFILLLLNDQTFFTYKFISLTMITFQEQIHIKRKHCLGQNLHFVSTPANSSDGQKRNKFFLMHIFHIRLQTFKGLIIIQKVQIA